MKVVFISNYFNHHQAPLCNEFYKINNIEFYFIATTPLPQFRIASGYRDMNDVHPFIIRAYESPESLKRAKLLAECSEVVIIGSAPDSYIVPRLQLGKLTFKYSERFFKKGLNWKNFIGRFIHSMLRIRRYQSKNLYFLCASAYTAADVNTFANFKGRCFVYNKHIGRETYG